MPRRNGQEEAQLELTAGALAEVPNAPRAASPADVSRISVLISGMPVARMGVNVPSMPGPVAGQPPLKPGHSSPVSPDARSGTACHRM